MPALVRRLAARNGLEIPPGTIDGDRYVWRDFLDFLATFDRAVTVIRTAADYRDITFEYLRACAAEGAIYVEVTISADHADQAGLPYAGDARRRRRRDRRRARGRPGSRAASSSPRCATSARSAPSGSRARSRRTRTPTSPASAWPATRRDSRRARSRARSSSPTTPGLGLTCHAGEWAGPESVRGALALPVPITRIGHGVRAIEDPELVRELAERGTVLEVCPTSNVVLGAYPGLCGAPVPGAARRRGARDARLRRPALLGGHRRRRVRRRPARVGPRRRRPARHHPHGDRGAPSPDEPPIGALSANSAMTRRRVH